MIAAAIFTSFRCSWPRDVRLLSSSASILIAQIPLRSWRTAGALMAAFGPQERANYLDKQATLLNDRNPLSGALV